jgi:hypothetical protein
MPHDAKGNLLKVGDKIVIPGTIVSIGESPEYCNCTIEAEHKMPPDNTDTSFSAINTRQVEKVATK